MSVQTASSTSQPAPRGASFAELFTPKLVTVLREGYTLKNLRADALAGLTVAIVALPLSMAIAIASGATPAQGLYTAAVGGRWSGAVMWTTPTGLPDTVTGTQAAEHGPPARSRSFGQALIDPELSNTET